MRKFNSAFEYLNIDYELHQSSERGFNFRPQGKNKKIIMGKNPNLDLFSINGQIRHEMLHVVRYENSKYNKIPFSKNYLPTEEGLASYVQDFHQDGHGSLFQHAAEYIASRIGLDGSLRNIYDFFTDVGFSSELAWHRSIRHKYGFIDTSKPGDIIKPAMYFYHENKIASLTKSERLRLFVGKISIEDLPSYPEYFGKFDAITLTDFFKI